MVRIFNCLLLPLFFCTALVLAAEKSISLLQMTIPRGVRWALGSTMIHSITTFRNFNNMPKIIRRLNSINQHSLCCVITFVIFDVIFMQVLVQSWWGKWLQQIAMFTRKGSLACNMRCPLFFAFLRVTYKIWVALHYKHSIVFGIDLHRIQLQLRWLNYKNTAWWVCV